ncbi:MAG TPA: ABC transporter ATP-binding protein [Bryobacteraceae bacterium]|nr:ABC transporter ATP-binding protein [Bryobacteraceae bacterium]
MAQIELTNVSKTYHDHVAVHALANINLAIEKGEFAAAVGPSGSGKTTLLNLIGALDTPDSGAIRIGELEITSTPAAKLADFRLRHLGFVFQSFNLFPVLSVLENLEFVPALRGLPKPDRVHRAEQLLEAVGMIDLRDKRPDELSGGQQQRVAVLRAILPEPDLVLADEPTANLDSENAALLLDMMERLNHERAVTFLFSTHDPAVMSRARRLIRLKDGRIVEDQVPKR